VLFRSGKDYFSPATLTLQNRETGKKKSLLSGVSSSISWSPDSRYILYSGKELNKYASLLNDLYLYDTKLDEEIRLSWGARASNPDFSNDGKKIAFVTTTNGLNQLNVYTLPTNLNTDETIALSFDLETGELVDSYKDVIHHRKSAFLKGKVEQVFAPQNNRQIYHPRWSNDDSQIVFGTAIAYGRDIAIYDLDKKEFSILLEAQEELRYPDFQPNSDWLYYSASSTGLYNLYRYNLKTNNKEMLTNVTGGAFMPSVAENGDVVYAAYDSIGYKVYELKNPQSIDQNKYVYDDDYLASIPVKNFDDSKIIEPAIKPYKTTFEHTMILPRFFIDYGTIKGGADRKSVV